MKYKFISKFLLINIYIVIISSCNNSSKSNNNNNNNSEILQFDVSKWDTKKSIPQKAIKNISFIPLETNKDILMSDIAKIIPLNEKYYVMDISFTNSILVFTNKGKHIQSIGVCGRGPGEYVRLRDFTIDKDGNRLLILDSSSRKIVIYNLDTGAFIENIKFDYSAKSIAMPNKNTVSLFSHNYTNDYTIRNINIDNKSQNGFLKNDGTLTEITMGYTDFYQSKHVYYAPTASNVVYKITEKRVLPYILLDFGEYKIPEDRLRTAIKNDLSGSFTTHNLLLRDKFGYGISRIIENNDFLTFSFRIKQKEISVIYSKKSKKYFYGSKFEGDLNPIGNLLSPIAVNKNQFLCISNTYDILGVKKTILKQNNSKLRQQFEELTKKIAQESNPVIISIEFNQF